MNDVAFRRTVRRFFKRYVSARVSFPKATGNLYELFIYTLVCESIQQAGCTLKLQTPVPKEFHFRSSPGGISNAFSYYTFNGPSGIAYELRNGIEVYGHSMMKHESDISIFRTDPGRSAPQGIYTELVLSIECKCYSASASLKGEVRKNVGMVQDWSSIAHASTSAGRPQGCIHCGLDFLPRFVTNVRQGIRQDIEQYLEAYDLGPEFGLVPNAASIIRFKNTLTQKIATL